MSVPLKDQIPIEKIIECWKELKNVNKTAEKLKINRSTVYYALYQSGLKEKSQTEQDIAICNMHKEGKSGKEIASIMNLKTSYISRILTTNGLRTKRSKVRDDGRQLHHSGYFYVWISKDDPMTSMRSKKGIVAEHRLVMARTLGRPLGTSETVHHIDGNKQNNHPDNLQLRIGKHGKGQSMECSECGSDNISSGEWIHCNDCNSTKIKFVSLK